MNINDVKNDILIDELQLNGTLGESVHLGNRSQFSLLLAMLTEDVQAHSQFSLPKTEASKLDGTDESQLRELFKVPKEQSLSLSSFEETQNYNQASLIENNSLINISLLNSIKPLPLTFRNDIKFIEKNIIENTSLYCQQKHVSRSDESKEHSSRSAFKAKEWLSNVKECLARYDEVV